MRVPIVLVLLLAVLAAPASAQDSHAPEDAAPYWLPSESWVMEHWLPYDEERLYELLRTTREELWAYLRDDRRTLAQFARTRGWTREALARALMDQWRPRPSRARLARLHHRTVRTLTQGHLAQHMLFHSLHQGTLPRLAPWIFGTRTRTDFLRMRRLQLSPLVIAAMHGRPSALVARRVQQALRATARRGVRAGVVSPRQAALTLGRQLRFAQRWLRNGRTKTRRSGVVLTQGDSTDEAALSADGGRVVFHAYDRDRDRRGAYGTVSVRWRDLRVPSAPALVPWAPAAAHNTDNLALSGDGTRVAYEASGADPARFGSPFVMIAALDRGEASAVAPPDDPTGKEPTFGASLSHDGGRIAFESSRPAAPDGTGALTRTYVCDLRTGTTELASRADGADGAPFADVLGSALSGDGRTLAIASHARELGATTAGGRRTAILLRDLVTGRTRTISEGAEDAWSPSLSHDGRVVAFASVRNGRAAVAVRVGDAPARRLEPTPAWDPALSADGTTVAFVAGRRRALWVVDVATGRRERVSPAGASEPALSGNGSVVAFTLDGGDRRDVYVRDRRGGRLRRAAAPRG